MRPFEAYSLLVLPSGSSLLLCEVTKHASKGHSEKGLHSNGDELAGEHGFTPLQAPPPTQWMVCPWTANSGHMLRAEDVTPTQITGDLLHHEKHARRRADTNE